MDSATVLARALDGDAFDGIYTVGDDPILLLSAEGMYAAKEHFDGGNTLLLLPGEAGVDAEIAVVGRTGIRLRAGSLDPCTGDVGGDGDVTVSVDCIDFCKGILQVVLVCGMYIVRAGISSAWRSRSIALPLPCTRLAYCKSSPHVCNIYLFSFVASRGRHKVLILNNFKCSWSK